MTQLIADWNVLRSAVQFNNYRMIKIILDTCGDDLLEFRHSNSDPVLFTALYHLTERPADQLKICDLFIKRRPVIVWDKLSNGKLPLHVAALNNVLIPSSLLETKWVRSRNGNTALHYAVGNGNFISARKLLVTYKVTNVEGYTPLQVGNVRFGFIIARYCQKMEILEGIFPLAFIQL